MFAADHACDEREHNNRAWAMWHGAALTRTGKQFPPLRRFTVRVRGERMRQTWQEQLAIVQAWNAQSGGKVVQITSR